MATYNAVNDYSGHTLSYRERPAINFAKMAAVSKPTIVNLGAYTLMSLPIYASDDEEIFFNHSVVRRWDGISNITVGCMAVIDTANTTKKFQLQLSWKNYVAGVVLPTATTDVAYEVTTGTDAQYMTYPITWTIVYDVDGANPVLPGQIIGGRIRRIAKSAGGTEITGEVMLHGFYVQYNRNKIGTAP